MKYAASKKVKLHISNNDPWTGLTEDGHFTNGHYSVVPIGTDSLPKEMYDKEKITAIIPACVPDVEHVKVEFDHIVQDSKYDGTRKKYYDILVIIHQEEKIYLNREYVDTILCRYPEATPWVSDKFHAVVFKDGYEQIVGIVIPIILD